MTLFIFFTMWSKKPWYFKFVFNEISQNYHKVYKSLFNNKYHVTLKFKKHEIKDIISIFVSSKNWDF